MILTDRPRALKELGYASLSPDAPSTTRSTGIIAKAHIDLIWASVPYTMTYTFFSG